MTSGDLDDDMVGPSIEGTKLRSNVYRTENADWQEIDVSLISDRFALSWLQILLTKLSYIFELNAYISIYRW